MVAAQKGTMVFLGRSGRRYSKQVYFDDVVGDPVRFDSGLGASAVSETFYIAPEPVILADVIVAAALTATFNTSIQRNGVNTGDMLLNALQLASVVQRQMLSIPFLRGDKISMIQLA